MEAWQAFFCGVAGGFLAELAGLFKLRQVAKDNLPHWLSSPFYWVVTGLMILSGGALVIFYIWSDIPIKPLALNIGASAPLIIGQFVSRPPSMDDRKID